MSNVPLIYITSIQVRLFAFTGFQGYLSRSLEAGRRGVLE